MSRQQCKNHDWIYDEILKDYFCSFCNLPYSEFKIQEFDFENYSNDEKMPRHAAKKSKQLGLWRKI